MAEKRCCLTALRQCSGGRFFLLFRPRAFGKARAQCCMQTHIVDIPSSTARPFSASRRLPVTCESRRIGGQMIYVRFGMWIESTRLQIFGFIHVDADAHRCSLLQPHSNPFPNPLQSQPHYRSPSKVSAPLFPTVDLECPPFMAESLPFRAVLRRPGF